MSICKCCCYYIFIGLAHCLIMAYLYFILLVLSYALNIWIRLGHTIYSICSSHSSLLPCYGRKKELKTILKLTLTLKFLSEFVVFATTIVSTALIDWFGGFFSSNFLLLFLFWASDILRHLHCKTIEEKCPSILYIVLKWNSHSFICVLFSIFRFSNRWLDDTESVPKGIPLFAFNAYIYTSINCIFLNNVTHLFVNIELTNQMGDCSLFFAQSLPSYITFSTLHSHCVFATTIILGKKLKSEFHWSIKFYGKISCC